MRRSRKIIAASFHEFLALEKLQPGGAAAPAGKNGMPMDFKRDWALLPNATTNA
ncbi:hypothetical protein [Pseudomonas fluorescens]|uniref:hypothetical protein n=1 Tax=Pseudomonas fluorescens TaxID=294 RepID=UPI0012D7DB57|nr:hypothetical protein [Pseudomonas fluorescens]